MDDFINQVMEAVQSPNEFSQDPTEEIAPIIQLEIDALNSCLGFILEIRNQQDSLQNQMSAITKQIAPNLTQLIGPLLSLRINHTGIFPKEFHCNTSWEDSIIGCNPSASLY